jgi:hypothetical protein
VSTLSDPHLPGNVQRPDRDHQRYPSPSTVPQTAAILHRRRARRGTPGVLQLGGKYIHCGEPMHAGDSGVRSIYAPTNTECTPVEQTSKGLLEVYLRTRVLRCGCGFQMEIPE